MRVKRGKTCRQQCRTKRCEHGFPKFQCQHSIPAWVLSRVANLYELWTTGLSRCRIFTPMLVQKHFDRNLLSCFQWSHKIWKRKLVLNFLQFEKCYFVPAFINFLSWDLKNENDHSTESVFAGTDNWTSVLARKTWGLPARKRRLCWSNWVKEVIVLGRTKPSFVPFVSKILRLVCLWPK